MFDKRVFVAVGSLQIKTSRSQEQARQRRDDVQKKQVLWNTVTTYSYTRVSHLYPEMISNKVLLPLPDGPIIPVNLRL